MPAILLGIVVLVIVLWAMHGFTKANPHSLARGLRAAGGVAALLLSAFLTVRGELFLAIPLVIFALTMLGWIPTGIPGFGTRAQKTPGQVSRVRSAFVEMELDHDSGAMRGRILAGRHEGVPLDALDVATLTALFPDIDEDSRALLAAYLDRRDAGWREHAQGDATAGQSDTRGRTGGPMTAEEAYQILGLEPGAPAQDIRRAHRALMKKLHPDQGGSTYLAARVNEAKDVLLRRHR